MSEGCVGKKVTLISRSTTPYRRPQQCPEGRLHRDEEGVQTPQRLDLELSVEDGSRKPHHSEGDKAEALERRLVSACSQLASRTSRRERERRGIGRREVGVSDVCCWDCERKEKRIQRSKRHDRKRLSLDGAGCAKKLREEAREERRMMQREVDFVRFLDSRTRQERLGIAGIRSDVFSRWEVAR